MSKKKPPDPEEAPLPIEDPNAVEGKLIAIAQRIAHRVLANIDAGRPVRGDDIRLMARSVLSLDELMRRAAEVLYEQSPWWVDRAEDLAAMILEDFGEPEEEVRPKKPPNKKDLN